MSLIILGSKFSSLKRSTKHENKRDVLAKQSVSHSTNVLRKSVQRTKNLNFITTITIAFFCCQLPIRFFLCWSYILHYFKPIIMCYCSAATLKFVRTRLQVAGNLFVKMLTNKKVLLGVPS